MYTKLVSLICVLALASTSFGEVLYDFGDGLAGWEGGWGPLTLTDDTHGATLGPNSLKMVIDDASNFWWSGDLGKLALTEDQVAKVVDRTYTEIKIDVTRAFDDWEFAGNWWWPESALRFTCDAGAWNEARTDQVYPSAIDTMIGARWYPTYLAEDPWNRTPPEQADGPDDITVTYSISLAPIQDELDAADAAGYSYDIDIGVHCMPIAQDYVGPVTYYIDNMQLVPEPATIALFGMGGLALLRRKRAH